MSPSNSGNPVLVNASVNSYSFVLYSHFSSLINSSNVAFFLLYNFTFLLRLKLLMATSLFNSSMLLEASSTSSSSSSSDSDSESFSSTNSSVFFFLKFAGI